MGDSVQKNRREIWSQEALSTLRKANKPPQRRQRCRPACRLRTSANESVSAWLESICTGYAARIVLTRLTTPSTLRVPLRIACCFAQTDSRAKLGRLHNSQCGSTAQAVGLSRPTTLTSNRSDRRKCDGRAQGGGARVTESNNNKAPSPTTIKH